MTRPGVTPAVRHRSSSSNDGEVAERLKADEARALLQEFFRSKRGRAE